MSTNHSGHRVVVLLSGLAALLLFPLFVTADVWVFEPSAAIDQRFDDNYTIDPDEPEAVSATRVVGTLGLSREAPAASFTGLVRVDGLITQSNRESDELSSNQVFFLNSEFRRARSQYGIGLNFKQDTPSRDISADITDISSVASDTGASVTQDQNVGRKRWVVNPNWQYNISRLTTLETELTYTQVSHELPSPAEARQAQLTLAKQNDPDNEELSVDNLGVFAVANELDDFREIAFDMGIKRKLSPITTISFFAGYSDYAAQVEPSDDVNVQFEDLIQDSDDREIFRKPKRNAYSNTTKFRVGYDRAFTPTLNLGFQVGIYTTNIDESDLLRDTDPDKFTTEEARQAARNNRIRKQSGYLANITVTKNTGITRYTGKFGVDVLPSDVGSQVESLEAVGDLFRELGPLLDFSFRVRAYEPDALNASNDSDFARRFLSIEPKLIWRFTRAWTVAGSYRYRRQKSQTDTNSGQSNAVLFSLKYTPPSAIRDAELNK